MVGWVDTFSPSVPRVLFSFGAGAGNTEKMQHIQEEGELSKLKALAFFTRLKHYVDGNSVH